MVPLLVDVLDILPPVDILRLEDDHIEPLEDMGQIPRVDVQLDSVLPTPSQDFGVLEPVRARPVQQQDDPFVGGPGGGVQTQTKAKNRAERGPCSYFLFWCV